MAEVFSNSPCMLGKRVLSPRSHSHARSGLVGQIDFSSKKRRLAHGIDQETYDRHTAGDSDANRPGSPTRAIKRSRPLSPIQPSKAQAEGRDVAFAYFDRHADAQRVRDTEEVASLRREVGALRAHVADKESKLTLAGEENTKLRDALGMYQKEVERLSSENRILKRAVGIQNNKGKELEGQLQAAHQISGQAAEYIKRLEQSNYALSVRLQTMGSAGPSDFMGGQRPPDVY